MAGVTFYGLLWAASANDQIAYHLQIPLYTVTWGFRVLVLAGPPLAFWLTRGIGHAQAVQRRDEELHGRETGRIVMDPQGGYSEVREPAGPRCRAETRPGSPVPWPAPARCRAHWAAVYRAVAHRAAVLRAAAYRAARPAGLEGEPGVMDGFGLLKRIGGAAWRARARGSCAYGRSAVEYLYVPCVRVRYQGRSAQARRWVQAVPVVKKTAKLIYYTSDSGDRREAVVSPGCISREQFEADTRQCCQGPPGQPGYPAGVIPIPGDRHRAGQSGWLFFATREAAEDYLYRRERERAGQAAQEARLIRELRRAMADAHPDRGGTTERFMQARRRYQAALRPALG